MPAFVLAALLAGYFTHPAPAYTLAIEPVGPSLQYLVWKPASIGARGSAFFVALDPQPAAFPNIVWAVEGSAAALEVDASRANVAYVDPAAGGVATLHAYVGPPVNRAIEAQLFAYRSFEVDCRNRPPASGAVFVTAAACAKAEVKQSARSVRPSAPALETPYGATLVPAATVDAFAAVSVRAFDGRLAELPAGAQGAALVRTRDNSIAKLWLAPERGTALDAPYTASSAGAEFPDTVFAASARTQTVGPVPPGVRIPGAAPAAIASPLIT